MVTLDSASALRRPGLTDLIGNTPLIRIEGLEGVPERVSVLGKAEWLNPGGSVKDRAAWNIVRRAEARGDLGPGRTLIDATSGNTGIAYAWIGAARGFRVRLALPSNANAERCRLLQLLGAELIMTDPMDGTDGAIREARSMAQLDGDAVYYPDQYSNDANWQAHYETTAPEIWAQTSGAVTHFVAGLGTTGTLVGTARRLKAYDPSIRVTAVQPDSPYHAMEGLKHLPTAMVPPIYDAAVHENLIEVSSDDAIEMVRVQAARGLMLGWSAGAAIVAAAEVARTIEDGVVVTVLPDGAERYLSDPIWDSFRETGSA